MYKRMPRTSCQNNLLVTSQIACLLHMQACLAREVCIGLLERSVTPANCFPLLNLASRCKLPGLTAAAHAVAVANFNEACELDGRGFHALPAEALSEVLRCDSLMVDNELQVFTALVEWVTIDERARLPLFHTLLGEPPFPRASIPSGGLLE